MAITAELRQRAEELLPLAVLDSYRQREVERVREVLGNAPSQSIPVQVVAYMPYSRCESHSKAAVFMVPQGFPKNRGALMAELGRVTATDLGMTCLAVVTIAEAWMAPLTEEEAASGYHGPPAKDRPDRVEILVVTATSIDGRTASSVFPLSHDDAGNVVLGEDMDGSPSPEDSREASDHLAQAFFEGYLAAWGAVNGMEASAADVVPAEFLVAEGHD